MLGRAAGQAPLEGLAPAPPRTDRLFFALLPSAEAVVRIEQLARELRERLGLRGRTLGAGRFHITLHLVGDFAGFPQQVVELAGEIAAAVVAGMPPFRLGFDRVASFRRPRNMPLVLRGSEDLLGGVAALAETLGTAMAAQGLGHVAGARYKPHLTLLYDDRHVPNTPIEPIAWTAHEVVLVRSLLGQSRHEPVARWPLQG
jgi:2'-5' RNA ligase